MICLAKKLLQIDKIMRKKAWLWPSLEFMGTDLTGKIIGLIGFGNIGLAMAHKAGGFGMKILVYDPHVSADLATNFHAEFVGLDTLLRTSDVISIHCVLTPETEELIRANELKKIKKTAFIIDVSRGAIINENAILTALEEKWIAGAGLDVFAHEPPKPGSSYLRHGQCNPHPASGLIYQGIL